MSNVEKRNTYRGLNSPISVKDIIKEEDRLANIFDMAGFSGPIPAELEPLQSKFKKQILQTRSKNNTDSKQSKFGAEISKMSIRYKELFEKNIE